MRYISPAQLESELDGSEAAFASYLFSLYQIQPDETCGVNDRRAELQRARPELSIPVGTRFVLTGESAWQALGGYYHALSVSEAVSDEFRQYAARHLLTMKQRHEQSQSLPVPIGLSEGQLCSDPSLELAVGLAIRNGLLR